MKPLEPANISEREVIATAAGWLELWKKHDPNTRAVVDQANQGIPVTHQGEAYEILLAYTRECMEGSVWLNDKYQVVRKEYDVLVHLSIRRLDRSPLERDWRDYQAIKNQLIGEECEAVELFPAESRLVDNANQFHLWGWNDGSKVPVGWPDRMVSEVPLAKAQQRPFEKDGE